MVNSLNKYGLAILLLMAASLLASVSAENQNEEWRELGYPLSEHFDTLQIGNNPQNFTIKQDNKGYIYIGNGAGLLIFNGSDWQTISHGDQQPIRSFELSSDGRIYTASAGDLGYFESDGLGRWAFQSLLTDVSNHPSISDVYKVLIVGQQIFFSTQSHLFYYSPKRGMRWTDQEINPVDIIEEKGNLLISTQDKKLYQFNLEKQTLTIVESSVLEKNTSAILGFSSFEDGNILAYTRQNVYLRDKDHGLKVLATEADEWFSINEISTVIALPDELLAVATNRGGIVIINIDGRIIRFYNNNHGLAINPINGLFLDREKSLWISSTSNGVTRVELNSPISYFSDPNQHVLSAVTTEFNDDLILGALDGVFRLKRATSPLEQAKFVKIPVPVDLAMSFIADGEQLIIGHSLGIGLLTKNSDHQYQYSVLHDGKSQKGLHVRQLLRSKFNKSIIYGVSKNGLLRLVKKDNRWKSSKIYTAINDSIYSVVEDKLGNLWLGTKSGSFYYLEQLNQWPHLQKRKLDYLKPYPPTAASIFSFGDRLIFNNGAEKVVTQLSNDSRKLVVSEMANWKDYSISSLMLVFQRESSRGWFTTWDDSFSVDRVGQLVALADGKFGIELSHLDRLELQFTLGLYESPKGVLWVNSKGKVVRYNSQSRESNIALNPPIVTKVEDIGSDSMLWANQKFSQQRPVITLLAEQNAIRIYFSSVEFSHAKNVQYRYKIAPFQTQWSSWQSKNNLPLTDLGSENYHLQLQYRVSPSKTSPVTEFEFNRLPFWYQSWWGQLVIAVSALFLVFITSVIFAVINNKKLHKKAKDLEKQVEERTNQIHQKNLLLKEQNVKLQQMDVAKNRFFTNISHEFRTPLSLSIGPLKELIASETITNLQDKNYLKLALKNNLYIMDLLGQVLDINKLESDAMPVQVIKINLYENLNDLVQRFHLLASKQQVVIEVVGCDKLAFVYFDKDHFDKVLLNLLSNAIKYSPVKSKIIIEVLHDESWISIAIKDQGQGISKDDQKHIFDRFYQGQKSSQTIQPGTGIGLSLVKEIINLHRCKIEVDSVEGKGSCFTVFFPHKNSHYDGKRHLNRNPDRSEIYHTSQHEKIAEQDNEGLLVQKNRTIIRESSKKNVLIVEDNHDLRLFIKSILNKQYNVVEAENGQMALDMVETIQPDIIISDVMMPVMDGFELARQLKGSSKTDFIPLIILTAKTTKKDTVEGLKIGADDYLTKPFDSKELLARIASQLANKQRVANQIIREFQAKLSIKLATNSLSSSKDFDSEADVNLEDKFSLALIQLIDQYIGDDSFDVNKMCEGMNTTRSTLFRKTKSRFDCTPIQLLKTRRLELSLELLKQHHGTISEVAYAVGFQSLSSFSRAFREHFKASPTNASEVGK